MITSQRAALLERRALSWKRKFGGRQGTVSGRQRTTNEGDISEELPEGRLEARGPQMLPVCPWERRPCVPAGPVHVWDGACGRVRVRADVHGCVPPGSALGLWSGSLPVGRMAGGPLSDRRRFSGCGGTAGCPRVAGSSEGAAMNSSALRTFNPQDEISSACAFSLRSHPEK